MAVCYFDSSAYVKLLVDEVGSDIAARLWDEVGPLLTTWDQRLRRAAVEAGLVVVPAALQE